MKLPTHVLDFIVCLFVYFIGPVTSVRLSPNEPLVERYVNETHVHSCYDAGVKWYNQKKQQVPSQGRIHVEGSNKESLLFFERLEIGDEGEYMCKDEIGNKESFTLKVLQRISFGSTRSVQIANEFQSHVLKCDVSAVPPPTVTWHFNNTSIVEGSVYKPMATGLRIMNVTRALAGEYQCMAYQTAQIKSDFKNFKITLKVNHKPMWTYRPNHSDRDMFYGYMTGMANLTCAAIAEPEATFTWKKNGIPLNPNSYKGTIITEPHRSILQMPILNSSYYGEYQCQATNQFGKIERIIMLEKGKKPDQPTLVEIEGVTVDTAQVKALSSGKDDDIIGFRIMYVVQETGELADWSKPDYQDFNRTGDGIYNVTGLYENTPYLVRVASRNLAGLSDFSKDFWLRTKLSVQETSASAMNLATLLTLMAAFVMMVTH